ncbi:hypothetical protein GN956_G9614 [Arapaima gigas]
MVTRVASVSSPEESWDAASRCSHTFYRSIKPRRPIEQLRWLLAVTSLSKLFQDQTAVDRSEDLRNGKASKSPPYAAHVALPHPKVSPLTCKQTFEFYVLLHLIAISTHRPAAPVVSRFSGASLLCKRGLKVEFLPKRVLGMKKRASR